MIAISVVLIWFKSSLGSLQHYFFKSFRSWIAYGKNRGCLGYMRTKVNFEFCHFFVAFAFNFFFQFLFSAEINEDLQQPGPNLDRRGLFLVCCFFFCFSGIGISIFYWKVELGNSAAKLVLLTFVVLATLSK